MRRYTNRTDNYACVGLDANGLHWAGSTTSKNKAVHNKLAALILAESRGTRNPFERVFIVKPGATLILSEG